MKKVEYKPITRAAYNRKIKAFHNDFEWLRTFTYLKPPPGYIQICINMLKEIELLLGNKVNDFFSGFYICDEHGRLSVNFSIKDQKQAVSVRETIIHIVSSARHTSISICCICSSPIIKQSYIKNEPKNFCKYHYYLSQTGLRFSNQFSHHQIDEDDLFDVNKDVKSTKSEPKIKLFESPLPPIDFESSYVKIFEPNHFLKLSEKTSSFNRDTQSRINNVIESTAASGQSGHRKLGIFSNAELHLAEFIDIFPNFSEFGNYLRDLASLYALSDNRVKIPPILFVGPPGIGKTEACLHISKLFGLDFKSFDMATAQSSAFLMGSDSFWSNTQVGQIFEQLCYKNCANPIFLLDEIDKPSAENRYDPTNAFYSLLEESTAKIFRDLSIKDIVIDASHINWICTANDIQKIPEPILSRLTIFEIKAPTPAQSRVIAQNIYTKILNSYSWGYFFEKTMEEDVLDKIVNVPPRLMKKLIFRGLGSAARGGRIKLVIEDFDFKIITAKPIGFIH